MKLEGMSVELHVERLVLDGVAIGPGQGERLREAVAARLAELLSAGGLDPALAAGGSRPRLAGGGLRWAPAKGTDRLGEQVARAAYAGLGPSLTGPAGPTRPANPAGPTAQKGRKP